MLLRQHNLSFNTVWEVCICANASPYGFLGFLINSILNILSARGLVHSEGQRNIKSVTLRNTELRNTKKAIYFTTPKMTFIKHPIKTFFCPAANRSSSARSARKTGCSLRGLRKRALITQQQIGHCTTSSCRTLTTSCALKLCTSYSEPSQGNARGRPCQATVAQRRCVPLVPPRRANRAHDFFAMATH